MRIFRSGKISDELFESLKKAGFEQNTVPLSQPIEEQAPSETGVPFKGPKTYGGDSGLDTIKMTLELPFDSLELGTIVPSNSTDEFEAEVWYDPRYEPFQSGGMSSEHIAGGYDPAIYHVVVQGRDVINVLPPGFVEKLEQNLGNRLNEQPRGRTEPDEPRYF